jgi:hypothetical protein
MSAHFDQGAAGRHIDPIYLSTVGVLLRRLDVEAAMGDETRGAPATRPSPIQPRFHPDMTLKSVHEIASEAHPAISAIDVQEFHDQIGKLSRRIHRI